MWGRGSSRYAVGPPCDTRSARRVQTAPYTRSGLTEGVPWGMGQRVGRAEGCGRCVPTGRTTATQVRPDGGLVDGGLGRVRPDGSGTAHRRRGRPAAGAVSSARWSWLGRCASSAMARGGRRRAAGPFRRDRRGRHVRQVRCDGLSPTTSRDPTADRRDDPRPPCSPIRPDGMLGAAVWSGWRGRQHRHEGGADRGAWVGSV